MQIINAFAVRRTRKKTQFNLCFLIIVNSCEIKEYVLYYILFIIGIFLFIDIHNVWLLALCRTFGGAS